MNKTKNAKTAKKAAKSTKSYVTVATNVGRLLNGSYQARRTNNGERESRCFRTIKAAKAWVNELN